MAIPGFLAPAFEWWSALYGDHLAVSVSIRFLHLAGIVVGGGRALASDRRTLRVLGAGADPRRAIAADLGAAHRTVVPALAVVAATGLLLAAADVETYLASRLYWTKMGLVALLLLNGIGLMGAERGLAAGRPSARAWLGATSVASLLLWLAILFAGVSLTVAA